jgi:hypothetical protein
LPNPLTGGGAPISKDLRKYTWAFYIAPIGSGATFPASRIAGSEPTGGWVRQGRLKDDDVAWNIADPSFLEGRAGFTKSLKWRVVNQAEMPELTARLDESDPVIEAQLRGATYTALSSGIYLGEEFIYKTGLFYSCKVLFIGTDVQSARENHLYGGNCVVTFKLISDPMYEGLEVKVVFLDVSSTETFRDREWD